MFLPTTIEEVRSLGWERLDIIIVSGDTYIDSPTSGAALLGKFLVSRGFRVGIIPQPDTGSGLDIGALGEPLLFWGVTGGAVDSMVANYTATRKRRKRDDMTPGGSNDRRPDRAVIAYANLIRRYRKNTAPIVLGGIEASLRRIAHYDYWSGSVRRAILFDAKADILIYGMGERAALEIAERLRAGTPYADVPGICYLARDPVPGFLELPSFEEAAADTGRFTDMFRIFMENSEAGAATGMTQRHGDRFLVHNPPARPLDAAELDALYELPFEHAAHPRCAAAGEVRALDTVRFSITTHRGCFGGCSFCAIAAHQGRRVVSRSADSIVREARSLAAHPGFRGIISDIGGPTANMYAMRCPRWERQGPCHNRECLGETPCDALQADHAPLCALLARVREIPGVRHAFVASGVRHDLVLHDAGSGENYLADLVRHHVSGQLKIAPEHVVPGVLRRMRKPGAQALLAFKRLFDALAARQEPRQFLTYYFIAAHPGCTLADMRALAAFVKRELRLRPEQAQVFTPTPSTWGALMYHTGVDPATGERLFVERDNAKKEAQKKALVPDTDTRP